jgi:hypothetical protein
MRLPAIVQRIFILLLLGGGWTAGQTVSARFDVHTDRIVGPAFVGFGADMNPYLFCRPNWIGENSAADLQSKIMALAPQHVRIFFLNSWANGVGDKFISLGDPTTYQSFLRTARMAQKAGASINLTLWYDPERWKDPEDSAQQFAFNLTKMLDAEHLQAIRYITIQNEPDGFPTPGDNDKVTLPKYVAAYRRFDELLRDWGMRNRVQIIAGDMVADRQPEWVKYLGSHLEHIADGYSIHGYWDYWNSAKILWRLDSTRNEFAALPAPERKPLYITEFGTRGHDSKHFDPGLYSDGRPFAQVPIQSMLNAWFMLKAVHDGYVSAVQWDMYDARYEVQMHYGLIGEAKDGWPLKPGYFLMKLLTHTCQPGWHAVDVGGDATNVTAATMRSNDGHITVWAVNHADKKAIVTLNGLEPRRAMNLFYWNAYGEGKLTDAVPVRTDAKGSVSMVIPYQAVIAVTTSNLFSQP